MYVYVSTKRARNWWIEQLAEAALGAEPTVWAIEDYRNRVASYRVQQDALGWDYYDRLNAKAPRYARVEP